LGLVLAFDGGAAGVLTVGGGALSHCAIGGQAAGKYVLSVERGVAEQPAGGLAVPEVA